MLVTKTPAADPDLEAIAVGVMKAAYQVADYDTVEALFDKLSIDNKKEFLREALTMSEVKIGEDLKNLPQTFVDAAVLTQYMFASQDEAKQATIPDVFERWIESKSEQTQLLGRLTLSLFEQSAENTRVAAKQTFQIQYPESSTLRQAEKVPTQVASMFHRIQRLNEKPHVVRMNREPRVATKDGEIEEWMLIPQYDYRFYW